MNFVIYDTETSGINRSFDQILQFAAILADDELREVDEFEIRCRLSAQIVPSISALRTNCITIHQLTDPRLPSHYEMVRRIREKLLSWSPSVFIGFNSIAFDENLLRQAFYATLHPPYFTNTNGNSRYDALRLIQASSLFAPGVLQVPEWDDGQRTYRLDRVAPANGFDHSNAHDAMADVRATLYLCRLVRERSPELWSRSIHLGRKPAVLDLVATEPVFCLSEFYYARPYCWLVAPIGHGKESNDIYLYTLAVDPQSLVGVSDLALRVRLAKRPKPVRRIRANAIPILSRLEQAPELAEGLSLGQPGLERRANFLLERPDLRQRLIAAFEANRKVREPSPYVEDQIYEGFFSASDQRLMETFHSVPWEDRATIVGRFDDVRLRELGRRLIYSERPDVLDESTRRAESERRARKMLGLDGDVLPWLTLRAAIQEANDHIEMAGAASSEMVEYRSYLQSRVADAMRVVG